MRATDNGPEQIAAADADLDEFVRSISVSKFDLSTNWADSADDDDPGKPWFPVVHYDTRKWQPAESGKDLTYRYLKDPAERALLVHVGMDEREGITVEKCIAELQKDGPATTEVFETWLGSCHKVKLCGVCCYFFAWPDQGVIVVRAAHDDPARIGAAEPDLDDFVRCVSVTTADASTERHPESRDLDRVGHLDKTAGEDAHSYFGTPLVQVLHAVVHCDADRWLQVPLEWDDRYPSPPQWADAMADSCWERWATAHPGTARPAPDVVDRTARELQSVAEWYGGFDELSFFERLTYVYLPDPSRHGIVVHVEVSDMEDETADRFLAEIDPSEYSKRSKEPSHAQLAPGPKPGSEAFATDALGAGRKITAHGTGDPRRGDPPGPPGAWAETRYAFAIPGRRDVVEVRARSSDPAALAAATPDLDEFVRGISTTKAKLPDLETGPYDIDALALLRAVRSRRKLQRVFRECVGILCTWIAIAIAAHLWAPVTSNLHHRMEHDAVPGLLLLGAIAAVPGIRLFIAKTRDPAGRAAAVLVSGVEPEVVQTEELDLYGPEVARGLVPLLRHKPLINIEAFGAGAPAIPLIGFGVITIREVPLLGLFDFAMAALSIYLTFNWFRFFFDAERFIRSTSEGASLADSVAALASGRRIKIRIDPEPGEITLGLPPDATPPPPATPPSRLKVVGAVALSMLLVLGLSAARYSGRHQPDTAEEYERTLTLPYVAAVTSRPHITVRTGPYVEEDVQTLTTAIGGGPLGRGWQVVITQFFRVPNPQLDFADMSAVLTLVGIGATPCAKAVQAASGIEPGVNSLPGLPDGWRGVQRTGPDINTRGVTFAGCAAGTLVSGTVYSIHAQMPDSRIATSATQLAAAIAQRGIPQFRADTAP